MKFVGAMVGIVIFYCAHAFVVWDIGPWDGISEWSAGARYLFMVVFVAFAFFGVMATVFRRIK